MTAVKPQIIKSYASRRSRIYDSSYCEKFKICLFLSGSICDSGNDGDRVLIEGMAGAGAGTYGCLYSFGLV